MYQTCTNCGIRRHVSLWVLVDRMKVKCPDCGYVQNYHVVLEGK